MYSNPTLLPQFTNRESLTLDISVFDADTGDGINLSGTTGVGTYTGWNVTTLNSFSTLVIPLTIATGVLALAMAPGLNILAGDSIVLNQTGNAALTMFGAVQTYNPTTGALTAQIGCTVQLEVREADQDGGRQGSGYVPYYDYGSIASSPRLTASVGNGITFPGLGIMELYFSETQMRTLHRGTYDVGCTIKSADGIDVRQLMCGRLPIFQGFVTN